jgi:hypothetical protein
MLREITKNFVVQRESFMLHDIKLFWHPSVLESFLLLNTKYFTVLFSYFLFSSFFTIIYNFLRMAIYRHGSGKK